jgi:hypothetical protein
MGRKRDGEPEGIDSQDAGKGEAEGAAKAKRYSVTIDPDLVRKLRVLAAAEDTSPPDWVNNQLRRLIKEQWRATIDELDQEGG